LENGTRVSSKRRPRYVLSMCTSSLVHTGGTADSEYSYHRVECGIEATSSPGVIASLALMVGILDPCLHITAACVARPDVAAHFGYVAVGRVVCWVACRKVVC
jgi:hypothetical protein